MLSYSIDSVLYLPYRTQVLFDLVILDVWLKLSAEDQWPDGTGVAKPIRPRLRACLSELHKTSRTNR